MAECDDIFLRLSKKAGPLFLRMSDEHQKTLDWLVSYKQEIFTKLAQAEATKCKVPILPKTPLRNRRPKRRALSSSTDDEDHVSSNVENLTTNTTDNSLNSTGKPKRNASKIAEQKINKQSQIKLNSKMRRPGKDDTVLNDISNNSIRLNIKTERQSKSPIKEPAPQIELKPENVKKEMMPPPAPKPKRGRKKVKKEVIDSSDTENEGVKRITRSKRIANSSSSTKSSTRSASKNRKDSDVILQEIPVPVVVLNDSDTEGVESQVNSEVESNTEDAKQVTDTLVEIDEDDRPLKPSKPKKKTKKQIETKTKKTQKTKTAETAEDSVYEDALSIVNKDDAVIKENNNKAKEPIKNRKCTVNLEKISPLNTTHVVEKEVKVSALNTTHVIQKEAKITILNTTHTVQKDIKNSPLNTTHVIQKEAKISPLNTTRVIENSTTTLNETHEIPKDNEAALKTKNCVTRDCSVVLQQMTETLTVSKSNAIADKTVVLTPKENGHHWKKADILPPVDNLLTDDDDSIVKATPEKKPEPPRKGVKTKQMFSPYANSPVRKRVAAFEKLVASDAVDAPTRVTRTKTRNMKKDKENETSSDSSRIPTKSRYVTPTTNNKLPSLISQTDSKAYRHGTAGNKITSVLPVKSASAMKPTKAEVQLRREEEQKKRLEKEDDARRKREALMQAKTEEQRRKREEKQLKAQKAREEMEREKEEKLRQIMQEKEEEQQKKREWLAKKLAESEERKKAEEMMKLLKQREQDKQRQKDEMRRKQLALKAPPLPTEDCEDSDSSTETVSKKKYEKPEWARSQYICRSLMIWKYIGKHHIESLWQMGATTPDLQEIFETIDEKLLRRNSSAVWRTPPRYSTLPKF